MGKFYEDNKYIQMCRKAEELQKIGKGYLAERLIDPMLFGEIFFVQNKVFYRDEKFDLYQIFRQDQLQEMCDQHFLLGRFVEYNNQAGSPLFKDFTMMWLCFVMKEKFNKIWDDTKGVWE